MISEQGSTDSLAQLVVGVSAVLLVVILFFIEKKLDQAQRILDELNLICIENKLENCNTKRYLHFYITKFHESKLNIYLLYIFYIFLGLLFITFTYYLKYVYVQDELNFSQYVILILLLLFNIIFHEILRTPYGCFFRDWDPELLLKSDCYRMIHETVEPFEMEEALRHYYALKNQYKTEKGLREMISFFIIISLISASLNFSYLD